MALEWQEGVGGQCSVDGHGGKNFRCNDCFGHPLFCKDCLVSTHARQPLHSIEKWNTFHFEKVRLGELGVKLFPGSLLRPQTAFTFEMMEHWHLESLQSKKPTWDYWQAVLDRSTALVSDEAEQKGYNVFMRVGRYWRVVKQLLRSGQAHGIDEYLPENRWRGNTTVVCPACPEPEFNLQEGWEKLAEQEKYR
ncbi:hypothetical protein AURDEDRAFT_77733 [Auricularia subglabra TFB-10046 SS5]|uniref:CxC2-like cysteine cluster KDZ transposase-associated domain-containing protein n=1 Tax=Auricularia subglabra (strain TFB-10046 / SS5) TaxID=717982 RepID=J0D178_AURST|nr:hypothetical protein AURDEDRAFT_77733 [Auricularia subglabra TFB-10046 SS5]